MKIDEMIKVMEHYKNGGEVEFKLRTDDRNKWKITSNPTWDWYAYTYRIKEEKQKVTIEKWLCRDKHKDLITIETSNIDNYTLYEKVKLIKSYEVVL